MKHENLKRALMALSNATATTKSRLPDWAACRVHDMNEAERLQLNRDMDYTAIMKNMKDAEFGSMGESRQQAADFRRALHLLCYLRNEKIDMKFNVPDNKFKIKKLDYEKKPFPPGGYYFRNSTLLFADDSERKRLSLGWRIGNEMLRVGMATALRARFGEGAARDLVVKWFGEANVQELFVRFRTLQNNLSLLSVGLGYQGRHLSKNSGNGLKLKEITGSDELQVPRVLDCWGVCVSDAMNVNSLSMGKSFFNNHTHETVVRPHNTAISEMNVTVGGAIVHELTHLGLKTVDQDLPNSVYAHLEMPLPANGNVAQAYGPKACAALAVVEPAMALENADNYRLFCEDACLIKPGY